MAGYAYNEIGIASFTLTGAGAEWPFTTGLGTFAQEITLAIDVRTPETLSDNLISITQTAEGLTGHTGEAELTLTDYSFDLSAEGVADQYGSAELIIDPTYSIVFAAEILVGMAMEGLIDIPPPTLAATGINGQIGTLEEALPPFEMSVQGDAPTERDFPPFTLEATGVQGGDGSLEVTLLTLTISADGRQDDTGTAELTFPAFVVDATASAGHYLSAELLIPIPSLSASGIAGEVGTLEATFPDFSIAAVGIPDQLTGTAELVIPVFDLEADGIEASDTETTQTLASVFAMNTGSFACTDYTNYPFNSYCYFNGVYLGASSAGIYRLDQSKDVSTNIPAVIEKQKMAFGSTLVKKATDAYFAIQSDGEYAVTMKADALYHRYPVRNGLYSGIRNEKLNVGKGLKGQYLGIRFENVRGSDITLQTITLLAEISTRRVRSASYG